MLNKEHLELLYFQVTDVWKKLCEHHTTLLDKTYEEYSLLLSSDIDTLEKVLVEKDEVIKFISNLDQMRSDIIQEINSSLSDEMKIKDVSGLIKIMSDFESENNQKHLYRFNMLLIDIIEKIQAQNKKNQLFINKAILNLRSIREETLGSKNYGVYNSKGIESRKLSSP